MKHILLIATACVIVACAGRPGARGIKGRDGAPAQSCTVTQLNDGALITCPDGSVAAVANGKDCKTKNK